MIISTILVRRRGTRIASLMGAVMLVASAHGAGAADIEEPAPDEWTFLIAPYFWGASLKGDVAQFGLPEAEVDASFSDIINNFEIGAMGVVEARKGGFSLFGDVLYLKLSAENDTPLGILAETVEADIEAWMVTAGAGYSVLSSEAGNLDVIAGARLWSVDTTLEFSGGILGDVSGNDSEIWVDPLVGIKGRANISESFYLTGWAMIGGFGVSSDLMWDVFGGIGYQFSDSFAVVGGYRALGVDYENDGFVYDVVQQGPMLGGVFRF